MEERRAKKNNGEEGIEDRLSPLPDSILLHILSFLPTKTTFQTINLVSTRYRYLWQNLQILDFDDDFSKHPLGQEAQDQLFRYFAVFVNSFLARRKSRDIRKMRLSCGFSYADEFSVPSIGSWIRTAIGPHLEELHLSIFSADQEALDFPLAIFNSCPNLLSLSLCGDMLMKFRPSLAVHLPSLKNLKIDLDYVDMPGVDIFLSGCPILETLEVSLLSTKYFSTLRVPHSLKSMKFINENDCGTCLELDAPDLRYLSLTIKMKEGGTVVNLNKADKAYIDVFYPHSGNISVDPLLNLLQALSGIEHLVLCCSTTKWLLDPPLKDFHYPKLECLEFQHLRHLELILPNFNIGFLYHMLAKCPMLQALIIQKYKDSTPHYTGWASKPKSVPNCLLSHLTFIHFKGCEAYLDEMKFVRYVLRKGLVLKTMHISCLSWELKARWEKHRILRRFSDAPRGSITCQLKVD